jgi:hypothetical protein
MLYTRFWELAIGSLIVFQPKQNKSTPISYIGIICIFTAIFGYNESMPNPSYFALLPTIGTAVVILFASDQAITCRVLSLRPLVWIGFTLYSSYLIHQPVFVFARIQTLHHLYETAYIGLILLTLSLSYLTWRFVEKPFRDREAISVKSLLVVILVYFICIRVDAFSFLAHKELQFQRSDQTNQHLAINVVTSDTDSIQKSVPSEELFLYGRYSEVGEKCFLNHCFGGKNTKVQLCRIGKDATSLPVYFLFGDSMAMTLLGAFNELEYSGMFAGLHGGHCSPLMRTQMNTTPSQVTFSGMLFFLFSYTIVFLHSDFYKKGI